MDCGVQVPLCLVELALSKAQGLRNSVQEGVDAGVPHRLGPWGSVCMKADGRTLGNHREGGKERAQGLVDKLWREMCLGSWGLPV